MKFFSDFFGKEIEIPEVPKRVVSLAPDITDIIFRIKADDVLVGISLYCRRPYDKLGKYERVGSYLKVLWNKLESLSPDLVLTTSGAQKEVCFELLKRGYRVFVLPVPGSIYGILDNIKKLSIILNKYKEGLRLIEYLLTKIKEIREENILKKVYYEVYLGGPVTIGASSYIDDGLFLIGFRNIYSFKKLSYFTPMDKETMELGFDLILYEPHSEGIKREIVIEKLRKRFGDKKIVVLPYDFLAHYGPSFIDEILPELKNILRKDVSF